MKISEQWLRSSIDHLSINIQQLADQLTMAGLEVESATPVAFPFERVVIGEVLSAEPHPNADRLRFCRVNIGENNLLDIVCGAPNVRAQLKVAVVLVDGVLNGVKIKKTKLRGVDSCGMICSERELGLSDEHGKILELPADAPIGQNLREYLLLDDHVIDVNLTPNRGDCASIRGLARELAAINGQTIRDPLPIEELPLPTAISDTMTIAVHAEKECPRYVGRIIRNINSSVKTPVWLVERLRRSGLRTIHPVVDVMNYVMLELGQPMHAFDLARLSGTLDIRLSLPGESVTLLDSKVVELEPTTLVIADQNGIQAVAGVMGALDSAVQAETQHIFLESAYFTAPTIAWAARHYGLHSESSYRFERGVDFRLQRYAIERASQLLQSIVGGQLGPIVERCSESYLPSTPELHLRREQIKRRLGLSVPDQSVTQILKALQLEPYPENSGWRVIIPSYRFDLNQEMDLIEEVARLYGYDHVPAHDFAPAPFQARALGSRRHRHIREFLVSRGYQETLTYGFVESQWQQFIDPQPALALANPMTHEMNVMRVSLWPGLLTTLRYNQHRQADRVRIFEIGTCFHQIPGQWEQRTYLSGLVVGKAHARQWGMPDRAVDFYDLKGDLTALFLIAGLELHFTHGTHQALHPGQSLAIYAGERCIGYIGAAHPALIEKIQCDGVPYLFEMCVDTIEERPLAQYQPISKFPAVHRDIAVVVPKAVEVQDMVELVEKSCGQILNAIEIFDIYQGKGIEPGRKSVALGLTFQDATRTLTDEEINPLVEGIFTQLEQNFNASRRL